MDEEEYDEYDYIGEECNEEEQEQGCPCGYICLDCLWMSWRDFF